MERNNTDRINISDEVLIEALKQNNDRFMEELPDEIEAHAFSEKFEKNMNRLINQNSQAKVFNFGKFTTRAAVIIFCLLSIHMVSTKAFKVNYWKVITEKTEEFINIGFRKKYVSSNDTSTENVNSRRRLKIKKEDIEGYDVIEYYSEGDSTVQILCSDNSSISYNESLIDDTEEISLATGEVLMEKVGEFEVTFISDEEQVIAFFTDDFYYHIVTIQGEDATVEFAKKVVSVLEEQ